MKGNPALMIGASTERKKVSPAFMPADSEKPGYPDSVNVKRGFQAITCGEVWGDVLHVMQITAFS
jgi:hypothetical protein